MKTDFKYVTLLIILVVFSMPKLYSASKNTIDTLLITKTIDPIFSLPYVDIDEWRDKPVRHRYVHGGFKGTDTRFSFYLPEEGNYQGRFFQYVTPVPDSENLSQGGEGEGDRIGFSLTHGAYFVETNGGGKAAMATYGSGIDPLIGAYKANAACAQYSKVIAKQMYSEHRTFGYIFGGSGGAYRTIGAIENTDGVWDGAVPFVVGSPMAIPNMFTIRMHAMRVLKDKFPQIMDAIQPGGSGDMYAGLNEEETAALKEATKMGFNPKSWFNHEGMGIHAFGVLYVGMTMADPGYFTDFWTKPGYLGYDEPESFKGYRIQHKAQITKGITVSEAHSLGLDVQAMAGQAHGTADKAWQNIDKKAEALPVALELNRNMPEVQFLGGDLIIKSGEAAGQSLPLRSIKDNKVVLGVVSDDILAKIEAGDEVIVDNSNFLAAQTYHRHQVPRKGYPVWDQFRDSVGNPIYPQRPMILGPLFAKAASGVLPKGKIKGKVILLESLWDTEALPWQGDWYRKQVEKRLGDQTDSNFRIWYTDHANHADFVNPGDPNYLVSFLGVLQQALLDLSAWVEKGIVPPPSTNYEIVDGQVVVPDSAKERKGIQPIVHLKANGSERADIKAGETVRLTGQIEIPINTGKIVNIEWDFEGIGEFQFKDKINNIQDTKIDIKAKHTFTKTGTYFPVVRITTQREGDQKTPYTLIRNIGKVRVVVN